MVKLTIGEYIKLTNPNQYNQLIRLYKISKPKKRIELGCSVEELMRHDSYKRVKGKLVQRGWG